MIVFCPLCQEFVELDETTDTVYRLTPERHKCLDCYCVTIDGVKGWRPVKEKGDGEEE